jgi:tetratricopeptide (TPR) repeat protein
VSFSDEARERAAQLAERAREQELSRGPYAPQLGETLSDLARALEEIGDYEAALRTRERAIHLIRVNEGLYSANQGPVLRELINSFRDRGDFEALNERYAYFFRLYGAGLAPFTELRWRAAMEYFRWEREAVLREIGGDWRSRLLDLHALQEERRQAILEQGGRPWPVLRDLSLSQLATLYLVEEEVDMLEPLYDPRTQRIQRGDPLDFDPLQERLESLKRTARSRGRILIEEALDANPDAPAEDRAELLLAVADWQQWYGSTRSAREAYERVWETLSSAGLTELRAAWFDRPVPLPAASVFSYRMNEAGRGISCRIDVSVSGRVRARGCQDGGSERDVNRLQRLLQASRFRPAFAGGTPVDVENQETRWLLRDD